MSSRDTMQDARLNQCTPCHIGQPAIKGQELAERFARHGGRWRLVGEHHLEKDYTFRNFKEALAFTNRVGDLAEELGHHPDIHLAWGKVRITIWTHKSDGLTENDFVLAAKADELQACMPAR